MPKITIFERDNTGTLVTGNEQVVFIPGTVALSAAYTKVYPVEVDLNGCYYLNRHDAAALNLLFQDVSTNSEEEAITVAYITTCLRWGYDVIYKVEKPADNEDYAPTVSTFECLVDKNAYNVKFITSGAYGVIKNVDAIPINSKSEEVEVYTAAVVTKGDTIPANTYYVKNNGSYTLTTDTTFQEGVTYYTRSTKTVITADVLTAFDCSVANKMMAIAADRKDAVALLDVDAAAFKTLSEGKISADGEFTNSENTNVDIDKLNTALNTFFNSSAPIPEDSNAVMIDTTVSSYGYLLTAQMNFASGSKTVVMPGSFIYLYAFMNNCFLANLPWTSAAGVVRGATSALGNLVERASKYIIDNIIIKDENGISFNGATLVRPYNECIWGDRTLIKLGDEIKATGFMSIRNLVSDIAKVTYNASIRHTYSSNNEQTWFNFTNMISPTLDRAVQSGVLSNYELLRGYTNLDGSSAKLNKMVCKIACYTNLPLENFDIYINLENAEVNTSDEA